MDKKERKNIKCSYALLVIVLFAMVAFLTDYIIIDRKVNKCVCQTCNTSYKEEISNTNFIEEKKDATKIIWNEHFSINCNRIENNLCYINNNNYEFIMFDDDEIEKIKNNEHVFSLNSGEKFGNVYILNDGYIFILTSNRAFILDSDSMDIVNDFKDYYDKNYEYNGVTYHDGYIDIYSTIAIHSSSVCYHKLNYDSDDIVEKIVRYEYIGNGKIANPFISKKVIFSEYLKEQTGYTNCSEFIKANS